MFKVEVKSVNLLNVKGKAKRAGKTMGKRNDWKKAYVRLAEGQDIDFFRRIGEFMMAIVIKSKTNLTWQKTCCQCS